MGGPAPKIVPIPMKNLPFHIRSVHVVKSEDLEDFLTEKLGKPVDIFNIDPDIDELSFHVDPLDIHIYDPVDIEVFEDMGEIDAETTLGLALDYAAEKGWIEGGDYVIDVT